MKQPKPQLTPFLASADTVAKELLGISRSKFYEMLSSGRCPLKRVSFGKRKLFRVDQVAAWVEGGCKSDWKEGKC